MGLISYTNMEDGQVASANIYNSRFSNIVKEINGNLDSSNIKNGSVSAANLSPDVYGAIYPVGSVYINADDDTNPSQLLGFGTWTLFSTGRMLVGFDEAQEEFNAAGKEGGTKEETLSVNQIPAHSHTGTTNSGGSHSHSYTRHNRYEKAIVYPGVDQTHGFNDGGSSASTSSAGSHTHSFTTNNRGGGAAHNNLPPFTTVYMWKRTA